MILVDVVVPSIEQIYDFTLNERTRIELVIEEIVEMISQKEHCVLRGNKEDLILCDHNGQKVLDKNETLQSCGIVTGSRLLLL